MTKSDTRELKGLAILMMLWLHLFSNPEMVRQCTYWLSYVNGQPLAYALTRLASSCVPIYIFLGGYGLAATYKTTAGHQLHGGRRALALMANFWLVFLIFVPIGCAVNPDLFPGSWQTLLLNATAVSYTYNGAWWFLLPYVLLTLTAQPLIARCFTTSRRHDVLIVAVMAVVNVGVYLLKSELPLTGTWPFPGVLTLFNYLSMLLLFTLGILAVKYNMTVLRGRYSLLLLLLLCLLKMLLGASSLLNVPFVLLAIPLFLSLRRPRWLRRTLEFFGLHSTNMWLIHYFYYYMFGHLIYRLHYPLAIFLALVAVSLACSMLIRPIFEPLRKKIRETT